jgi:uncharacterized protein with von Willebrand factor type A (vWA) domain
MNGEPEFSLADAEATFGPENWEQLRQGVAAAPEFSPEQREKFRALFASAPLPKPGPAADAA